MAYTTLELALSEYKKLYGEPDSLHVLRARYGNNGVIVEKKYKRGVMIFKPHEEVRDTKVFKRGNIYSGVNGGPILGHYQELQ